MRGLRLYRVLVVLITASAVLLPLGIVLYQSVLDAPFFQPSAKLSTSAFAFVFSDPDFHRAFATTALVAVGMTLIAVPLGSILAFLLIRTDLPGRRVLEPVVLIPIFLSPVVLAFGYVVAAGPVGFFTLWFKEAFGSAPWNVYSLASLIVIAGLTHIPYVFLYTSSALRALGADLEEAARVAGAGAARVAFSVSLPMVRPAILYSAVLVFFLGFELFGLPLILGDPGGLLVLSTYLYKLTNRLGVPSYQLMAVVAVAIIAIAFPLVYLQRRLIGASARFVTVGGKGLSPRPLRLSGWRWPALALVLVWLAATVLLPLSGVFLRAFVSSWGEGIRLAQVITLENFRELFDYPNLVRGILNTLGIATFGGALAVAWSSLSVRFAVTGALPQDVMPPDAVHLVYALDLSLLAPGFMVAGVLLWRRTAWGFLLAVAMNVFGAAYLTVLWFVGGFEADAGIAGKTWVAPTAVLPAVLCLVGAMVLLRAGRRYVTDER